MATTKADFIDQARKRWHLAATADEKQRERELEDLKFYAGDQWPADLLRSRAGQSIGSGNNQQIVPARPSLVINKTREPVRQILNQERQSDLGISLIPADDWGEDVGPIDHTEIELREGLVRRIQRDSEASDARTWAFARAVIGGRGYWLVMTRYVPGKSADQEVYIERIYNQASVLLDPSHEQPDGSDAEWGFYGTDMLWSVFKAEYPKARVSTVDSDEEWRALGDEAPEWFTGDGDHRSMRVVNYYYTERESKTLYHLSNGRAAYKDELDSLPPDVTVLTDAKGKELTHTETVKSIKWCKLNGVEVLDETDWPGHWIPIIKTVGDELQPYDQERRCEGVVRPMREACKGNNYIVSKFVERVGLTSIPPVMMADGQDEGFEAEWDAINTRALSRLHYNMKDSFGNMAPPPFRADFRAEIGDIATGMQIFGEAIQATSVMPETSLGHIDPTVKSGKLAQALIEQGDRGTSNFLDNLVRSLRHEARVVNDLLYPIYGRPGRLARMMNGQGEMSAVLIDQPFTTQGEGPMARPQPVQVPQGQPLPPGAKQYHLTEHANFNVAVKVSRTIETRRMQIAQFLGELIGSSPDQMAIVGDKLWQYLDVPDHEEIEERYKLMLAPPIQQMLSGKKPIPPEVQQQMAQMEQMVQALSKELEAKTRIIETDQIKAMQQLEIAKVKGETDTQLKLAELEKDRQEKVAELTSKEAIELRKLEVQLEIEMAKLGSAEAAARAKAEMDSLHLHSEREQAEADRAEGSIQADLDRQAEKDARADESVERERDREVAVAKTTQGETA